MTNAVKFEAGGITNLNNSFSYTADGICNVLTEQSPAVGGGESLAFSYNKQNQLTSVPHSASTPFIGKVNASANLNVLSDPLFPATKARQGEDYRVRLATGTTNVDRYLPFTNYAVINTNVNSPDVVASGVVNRFLPANATETPTYDSDGNLTADGRWTYTWDALNRLTAMESKSTAPAASKHKFVFTYDAGGRRIALTDSNWVSGTWTFSSTKKFLYNGWDLIAELDGSGNAIRTYGWLGKAGGLLWVKDAASGEYHVPSFDGNRNVTRLIKYSDRTVSAEYEYAPYGGQLRATGPMALANPFRFSSEYHDEVTGLVYYGLRYYSPQTHRWLSKDPIGYRGGRNLYGFVFNDPINQRDVYGLGLLSFVCGQGWSGEDADAFEESIGESMMEQGAEMADGWRVLKEDGVLGSRDLMVDEMSDRYADMMLNYGEGNMYIIAANDLTGGTMLMEGANGIDLQTQMELNSEEALQRMLMGSGQMLLTATGGAESISSARAGYPGTGIRMPKFRRKSPLKEPGVESPTSEPSGTTKPAVKDCPPNNGKMPSMEELKKKYPRTEKSEKWRDDLADRYRDLNGNLRDVSGKIIDEGVRWQAGHKGMTYAERIRWAYENGLTREEWFEWENNPNGFRPEYPSSNESHFYEDW